MKPNIDIVWQRITSHVGEEFETVMGKTFSYEMVDSNSLQIKSRKDFPLTKYSFNIALSHVPASGPGALKNADKRILGASYTWAILHDDRIRQNDW